MIMAGGAYYTGSRYTSSKAAFFFDLRTKTWTRIADMVSGREYFSGRLFVMGVSFLQLLPTYYIGIKPIHSWMHNLKIRQFIIDWLPIVCFVEAGWSRIVSVRDQWVKFHSAFVANTYQIDALLGFILIFQDILFAF